MAKRVTGANVPIPQRVIDRWASQLDMASGIVVPRMRTECWLWTGAVTNSGYGIVCWCESGVQYVLGAHTMGYRLMELDGLPLPGDSQVNHRCDQRLCCNAKHQYLGDAYMNSSDLWARGSVRHQEQWLRQQFGPGVRVFGPGVRVQ